VFCIFLFIWVFITAPTAAVALELDYNGDVASMHMIGFVVE
jgi:hypothetical protein